MFEGKYVWHSNYYVFVIHVSRLLILIILYVLGQLFTLSNPEDAPADDLVSDQDLVVVSVSYRINVFGFLCTEG
jgi:hypothetical protein